MRTRSILFVAMAPVSRSDKKMPPDATGGSKHAGASGSPVDDNASPRADDQLSVPQPDEGDCFSDLTGILAYTYGHTKLEPWGAEDVAE